MLLLVCKSPPDGSAVREWADMALMTAMFQQKPVLLLLGPGVQNLTTPDSALGDLAGLVSEPCRVDATALPEPVTEIEPVLDYQPLEAAAIRALFEHAHQVITL